MLGLYLLSGHQSAIFIAFACEPTRLFAGYSDL
jgi:hypothetical protein